MLRPSGREYSGPAGAAELTGEVIEEGKSTVAYRPIREALGRPTSRRWFSADRDFRLTGRARQRSAGRAAVRRSGLHAVCAGASRRLLCVVWDCPVDRGRQYGILHIRMAPGASPVVQSFLVYGDLAFELLNGGQRFFVPPGLVEALAKGVKLAFKSSWILHGASVRLSHLDCGARWSAPLRVPSATGSKACSIHTP